MPDHNLNNITEIVNNECIHTCKWLRAKTKSRSIFLKSNLLFFIINVMFIEIALYLYLLCRRISQVYNCKFLGILTDERLNWSYINYINQNISKNIGVISRLRHFMYGLVFKLLYNSLILR